MKTVLITGAAGGLGAATAKLFLDSGFRVISTDLVYPAVADHRPASEFLEFPVDVRSDGSVVGLRQQLSERDISVDILINNAGIFELYPLTEIVEERFIHILNTNTLGAFRMVRTFLPDLIKNKGRVVQISSESVRIPGLFQPYQVTKIALEAYSRSVRQELALKDIGLAVVRPGAIRTGLYKPLDAYENPVVGSVFKDEFKIFAKKTTQFLWRISKPEKVARLVFRAATSKKPKYIYQINNNPLLIFLSYLPQRLIDRMVLRMVGGREKIS